MNRRDFIKYTYASGIGLAALTSVPLQLIAKQGVRKISILHTNDLHSRIDPFPMDGSKYQGLGGFAKRASLINKIRTEEEHVLLLDAGDILQGTPYFNFFQGELEFKLMSEMKYDAATFGNHDFDAGIDRLSQLADLATFPFISSNYDFSSTSMDKKSINNKIFKFDGIRVGIYGLGIELDGLVPDNLYRNTVYMDPLRTALKEEEMLKTQMKCDLIICLSHLGFEYESHKISDITIGTNTNCTDLIIGGHTHSFLSEPRIVQNLQRKNCRIFQVGWGGINLGRVDFFFNAEKKKIFTLASSFTIS